MLKLIYTLIVALACITSVHAHEYLYPVGHTWHDGYKLLLLYQKSVHHVELWQWDPVTLEAGKALLSSYTPAGIATLPNNQGFSFIDNDTIRVAYGHKRSPLLIPLYEPLYDFTTIQWQDTERCILSAKEAERYGIYVIDIEGRCWQLLHDAENDYRYPNLINNQLFYIQAHGVHHRIMQATVDFGSIITQKKLTREDIFNSANERSYGQVTNASTIVDCKDRHIAFLSMVNEDTGFYLEHPACIDRHDSTISFGYYQINKQGDTWQDTYLFSFSIPMAYLMSQEERLYESILPFLPQRIGNSIYFFDCQDGAIVTQLWNYNMITHTAEQITHAQQSVMGVYQDQEKVWFGGVLQEDVVVDQYVPTAWVGADGAFYVKMPTV